MITTIEHVGDGWRRVTVETECWTLISLLREGEYHRNKDGSFILRPQRTFNCVTGFDSVKTY